MKSVAINQYGGADVLQVMDLPTPPLKTNEILVKVHIIFDVVGNQSFWSCQNCLQPNGVYITTQPYPINFLESFFTAFVAGKKAKVVVVKFNGLDLKSLKELIDDQKVRPVIAQTYPLSAVAEAHRESEQGHVAGKLVIMVAS